MQTNKPKHLVRFAREFHALDGLHLASLPDDRLARETRLLDVLVQVNTSGEDSEFGLFPDAVLPFVDEPGRFVPCAAMLAPAPASA